MELEIKRDPGAVTPHHPLKEEKTVKELERRPGSVILTPARQVAELVDEKFDTKILGGDSGFLIVGGGNYLSSAEQFIPKTGHSYCPVDDLPWGSLSGTLCNNLYCGGGPWQGSCARYNGAGSVTPLRDILVENRVEHMCWGLPSGEVILLGGYFSQNNTEKVSANGTSSLPDFNLAYNI